MFIGIKVKSEYSDKTTQIICNIPFKQPEFYNILTNNKEFTYLKIQDCISFAEKGKPMLPIYPAQILIPYGSEITNIEVFPECFILLKDDLDKKPIMPQQESIPFIVHKDKSPLIMDENIYEQSSPVSDNTFSIGKIGYYRGYKIITIFLYPIKYIPKKGLLYYTPEISITINIEISANKKPANKFLRFIDNDRYLISSLVENPEDIATYDYLSTSTNNTSIKFLEGLCDPAETYNYVIITNNSLRNATGYLYNWSNLISHRQIFSNLSGTIITVEDIDSCSDYWNETSIFNDTQAHIREFCKDAYDDWETEYILLGGDWDSSPSNQIVPYREFTDNLETETYDSMACDLYYSHLDGDWYYSDEGIWGGGKNSGVNDLYGELFIGRITASTAEDVSNAVYKIINYDINTSLSNEWLRSVSFWGGNLEWTSTSKQYMEEIRLGADIYRTFTGFEEWNDNYTSQQLDTSERLYHGDLGSDYKTYFSNSVENDNASIINHLDHSTWNSPMGLIEWGSRFNTKPFLGYSQGCLAGRYQEGDSGCEWLICKYPERHAYALILNTGYGYGSGSNTDGASQYIMAYFWDYFFNNQSQNKDNWQLGKAINYAKDKIASIIDSHSHAWCYTWYSTHFFGDPAQTLRVNQTYSPIQQTNPNPNNESMNISTDTTILNVNLTSQNGYNIDWTIETNPNIGNSFNYSDNNGIKTCSISNLSSNTTYYWFVNSTDGITWSRSWYIFTTNINETPPINNPPIITLENPINNTNNIAINLSFLNITIYDSNNDTINWTIETNPNIGNISGNSETNGVKTCNISGLNYNITYKWLVNASDGYNWTNNSYQFTTRTQNNPGIPSNFNAHSNGRFQIDLAWNKGNNSDFTYIEWNTSNSSWDKGSGIELYNGTGITTSDQNLSQETSRFYQAWSYNSTYNTWTILYAYCNATTNDNIPPTHSIQNLTNGSSYKSTSFTVNIEITDSNGDSFNWSIECNNGQSNSENNSENGTKQLFLNNLSYYTTYYIWINTTDGYDCTREWIIFTTMINPQINYAPYISSTNPENGTLGLSTSHSLLSINIDDTDGDILNWSIETFPDIGSKTGYNDTNGTKICTISNMDYSTTYYWFVNVSDGNHTVNNYYYFRTTSPPIINPQSGDSSDDTENIKPIADSNGPYTGYINEKIIFDGSNSIDSDGTIISYNWDFGDGNTSAEQTTEHTYMISGNYTVILTVTDNDDETNTDSTYANITIPINQIDNLPSAGSESKIDITENADDDNDGISNHIEERIGSNPYDDSDVLAIKLGTTTHYLIDINEDGNMDIFYNTKTESYTTLKYNSNNLLLIDTDGDANWDYTYNLKTNYLSSYKTNSEYENIIDLLFHPLILFLILILLICTCIVYLVRYRLSFYLVERRITSTNPNVHFFTESNEENNDNKPNTSFKNIDNKQELENWESEEKPKNDDIDIENETLSINELEEKINKIQEIYEEKSNEEQDIDQEVKKDLIFNSAKQNLDEISINILQEKIDINEIQNHIDQILENKAEEKLRIFDIDSTVDNILNSKILDKTED